jgi:hypothetical protein
MNKKEKKNKIYPCDSDSSSHRIRDDETQLDQETLLVVRIFACKTADLGDNLVRYSLDIYY